MHHDSRGLGFLLTFALAAGSAAGCTAETTVDVTEVDDARQTGEEEGDVGDVEGDAEIGTGARAIASAACSRAKILGSVSGGRKTAITRGFTWLDADVPYSQSRSYKGFRTDCSGFVSMSWQLDRSYTTASFVGTSKHWKRLSSYDALRPADALVRRSGGSGHIVLFLGWSDASRSQACVLEQASTAQDMQFRARSVSSLRKSGYKAIAATKLGADDEAAEEPVEDEAAEDAGSADAGAAEPAEE